MEELKSGASLIPIILPIFFIHTIVKFFTIAIIHQIRKGTFKAGHASKVFQFSNVWAVFTEVDLSINFAINRKRKKRKKEIRILNNNNNNNNNNNKELGRKRV